ncbi:hypothetical protein AcV7_004084 [Taiwanofungus camphoratus]|nr:hypothetical protein AcV7_004084 [Antrodia cinnamomea]
MHKRALSPSPLPPPKRLHISSPAKSHASPTHAPQCSFDALLYDEIVLAIFSYLSWTDLCAIQSINRNWSRLSLDNQLWKALYLSEYGRTRLRGVRGFIGRNDGREVRPLPGRAKSEDIKDWKWMFRISANWRTGRCSVELLDTGIEHTLPRAALPTPNLEDYLSQEQTFVLLAGNITIIASSRMSSSPVISLTTPAHETYTMHCPSTRSASSTQLTALALDQSPPTSAQHVRLVAFLSTGEYVIFSINHHTLAHSSRVLTYVPSGKSSRTSPISQAVYHHPVLITLSQSFHLSLYDLSSNTVTHTQTLTSFTSYPPSSLVLSTPTPSTYKLVLAYAIPVYPAHWSVGATEFIITRGSSSRITVSATRTTRAIDMPQGWIDEHKLRAVREQWGRKVARVADTQTDGKWVVLAPGVPLKLPSKERHSQTPSYPSSSTSSPLSSLWQTPASPYASSSLYSASALQLYRLHLPASISPSSMPKLTFVRSLHGQIGPVAALSLADGRCVSLGVNGSIWVWDLEGGTGAEVSNGIDMLRSFESQDGEAERLKAAMAIKGTVTFDERRIISTDCDGVHVRRFDI